MEIRVQKPNQDLLEVIQFPCLSDNYGFVIHVAAANLTATIDTPDVETTLRILDDKGWHLTHILNTHHHFDHAGGNLALKEKTGCTIVGPRADQARIPGLDIALGEGDRYDFGGHVAQIFDVPGHTRGHIAYWFAEDEVAFVGDVIFALGCGRLFEGTPAEMWNSLQKMSALPDHTLVFCAHEYTQANARFALTVEPGNKALVARAKEIDQLRAEGKPTVPTTIGVEKKTNPFLRPTSPDLQATIGLVGADPVTVFAETRRRKDQFRG